MKDLQLDDGGVPVEGQINRTVSRRGFLRLAAVAAGGSSYSTPMIYGLEITRLMIAKRLTGSRSLFGAGIAGCRQFDCGQDFALVYASSITADSKAITRSSRHSSDYAFSLADS